MITGDRLVSLRPTQEALRVVLREIAGRPRDLETILEASSSPLVAFDASRTILHANAGAEELFGYERGGLAGLSTAVLVPGPLRRPDAPAMTVTDDFMQVDIRGLLRDGSERLVEWCFGGVCVGDRAIFVTSVRDRRELDLELDELRASEERFPLFANLARLQRVTAALSQSLTPHEVVRVVLDECLAALGADAGSIYVVDDAGTHLELLGQRGHSPAVMAGFTKLPRTGGSPLTDAGRDGVPSFFENRETICARYPALRAALEAVDYEAAAALPLRVQGELIGVMGLRFVAARSFAPHERAFLLTTSDVCAQALERARLFAAERAARAAAEAASRSKDEFLAMLGHELRNPLAPISTAVKIMKLKGEGGAHECDVIERQVAHIGRLVDDLLDVSRVARGLVALSRAEVDLAGVVDEAVEMASPLFDQRRQRLDVALPQEPLHVDGDAMRLAQILANLLTNAAKYTPEGGRARLDVARDGDDAVIRVRDDGEGIGPELLPVVFDRFVQGERTIDRSQGGLGLGLALVKSLVALHGGTVTAASDGVGKGSEFVVRIPALAAVRPPRPAPAVVAAAPAVERGKRILVVDDNDDARDMLAHMLRLVGHEVEIAADGPTALRRLSSFDAEVAILDIGLPVMDGFELARRVCAEHADRRPRLIALTGYGQRSDIEASRVAGFDVHLVKPVEMAALTKAIDPG